MQVARVILAILVPPIGVLLTVGVRKEFWVNVLLTILGWVPGMVHALVLAMTYPPRAEPA